MAIPASNEGLVYVGLQSVKGTAASTLHQVYMTEFSFEPDVVQDEGEAVIGRGLDVDEVERYGFNGVTVRGAMRFRPGNVGYLLLGYGLACTTTGTGPYVHDFEPITASASFPYLTIIDKFDASSTLDVMLVDVRINSLTVTANERDALRLEFEGRALSLTTTLGSPTLNGEVTGLLTPNTAKGDVTVDAADYCLNTLTANYTWGEALATCLTDAELEQVIVQGRNVTGTADVFLGANADLWEEVYLGGAAGTTLSTIMTSGAIVATFESGGDIPTEAVPFHVQLGLAESKYLTYPLGQTGDDPVRGGLTFQTTRITTDWYIQLQNAVAAYT